jgi:hypothetical protein
VTGLCTGWAVRFIPSLLEALLTHNERLLLAFFAVHIQTSMCLAQEEPLKVPEAFRDAEALADFANLDPADSAAVDFFRVNYGDFAPLDWWDYKVEEIELIPAMVSLPDSDDPMNAKEYAAMLEENLVPVWQSTQEEVQRAWAGQFQFEKIFGLTELLKAVFVAPDELVRASLHLNIPDGQLSELGGSKLYTYHKAVLYLIQRPWQAKICKSCNKYFVASHPKRDYCEYPDLDSETCREKNDKSRKLDYYYTTGKGKRQAKKRKSSPRLPGWVKGKRP